MHTIQNTERAQVLDTKETASSPYLKYFGTVAWQTSATRTEVRYATAPSGSMLS